MLLAVADNVTKAAWISLVRFWRKRSPTRIAGTSVAKATSTRRRVRRLIVAILRIPSRQDPCGDVPAGIRRLSPKRVLEAHRSACACAQIPEPGSFGDSRA